MHEEWVYNEADLDESPFVWFRAKSEKEVADVMRFFPGLRLWVADVERDAVKVANMAAARRYGRGRHGLSSIMTTIRVLPARISIVSG